ncbi:MAG: hypothetical protein EZS28_007417 [Streblomastix strix]|uniref:Protein kinase domain-containing protein n=1 Tax=Streblomastix strix TaxID=222440 RepID=A0A5J4WR74_9EUKA|nr:MAG: hypothetical protein EZS28_007417 [Streblomastix strix]
MESDVIQMATVPVQIGELVGSTFVTEKLLAAGKTSTILIARSKGNPDLNLVALKVQPIYIEPQTLNNDIAVLKSTQGKEHFSKIYMFGTHRQFSFMAVELLGPTLSDIIKRPQMEVFSISSVVKVGIQGLEALSTLHSAGFVHGQVNSKNFAIGYTKESAGIIYLIGIGDYSQLKFILQTIAQSNGGNLINPFEWEVEIEQLIISETLKQKQDLKNRQESLLSFLDEIKKPRTLSNSRDGRGKAVQLALQSLPQKKTANGDLNTISLLQIQPKIRKLPRLHIDLQNPQIISQRGTSPLSSHSVSSSYLSQMSGSQSPSQLSSTLKVTE